MLGFRSTPSIKPPEAAGLLERGEAVALDVRNPGEWQAGRIPGALHVPLGELQRRAGEIPADRRMIAVCRSGSRSGAAASALSKAGYQAENLSGGMKAWHRAGLPMDPPGGRVA